MQIDLQQSAWTTGLLLLRTTKSHAGIVSGLSTLNHVSAQAKLSLKAV